MSAAASAFDYFWRSRDALFSTRLEQVRPLVTRDGCQAQSIKMLALGHTHLPAAATPITRSAATPLIVNSGAWQRTVTPFQAEEMLRERSWTESDLLRQWQPEQLPPCYP